MKINQFVLAGLFIIVAGALGALLVIQFRIIDKDIATNQNMMKLAIPDILSDLYDNMMFNNDLRTFTDNFYGTDSFRFTSNSAPTDSLQLLLKKNLDEVISRNYPELHYVIDGFISHEYGCMIHRGHRPELPKARFVMEADNHMCFCMMLDNTLDISMTYTNLEETAIGNSAGLLRASFVIILLILAAFWYTIYTIRKQKRLSDLKRDFINNLTHEFKTPIFSISLAANALKSQKEVTPSPALTSYADVIMTESRRLKTQVEKILQTALLESGNINLEKNEIDLHDIVTSVAKRFDVINQENKGKITLKLEASNSKIIGDETHLNNVLFNLIDNGIKYSDNAPDITITTCDDPIGLLLTVQDRGIGIDKNTQKHIFEQFYRGQKGDVHDVKGFGLGLSYVKKIVEYHKGKVHLKSTPGEGSEFLIYLPVLP